MESRRHELENFRAEYRPTDTDTAEKALELNRTLSETERLAAIERLERACLNRAKLLEEYQVILRGDFLPAEILSQLGDERSFWRNGITSHKTVLETKSDRLRILQQLMSEIVSATSLARTAEDRTRTRKQEVSGGKGVLTYSFERFRATEPVEPVEHFFSGHSVDTPAKYVDPRYILLPDSEHDIEWMPYNSPSEERSGSHMPNVDQARIDSLQKNVDNQSYYTLIKSASYLSTLMLADKMLKRLEEFKRESYE